MHEFHVREHRSGPIGDCHAVSRVGVSVRGLGECPAVAACCQHDLLCPDDFDPRIGKIIDDRARHPPLIDGQFKEVPLRIYLYTAL